MIQVVEVKKYAYIDALRGIAVLGTLMVHCSIYDKGINDFGDLFKRITFMGSTGVQLFFMMSAITLFMSYDLKKGLEQNKILNFYLRRFFRIAPLFYAAAVFYLFLIGTGPRYWLGNESSISFWNIISTFSFTNSINPYWINSIVEGGWSIAIEMVFYLIFPLLFVWINSFNRALWLLNISLIISSVFFHYMYNHPMIQEKEIWNAFCYFSFPSQLPVFMLGINIYFILKEKINIIDYYKINGRAFFVLGLILMSHVITPHLQDHILMSFAFFIIILIFSQSNSKILINNVICWIGKLSFSMYLIHFSILFLMWKLNILDLINSQMINFGIRYTILIILTSLVAYLTYRFIELPGVNLGKKIIIYFENKRK
jgi:peptidoglycan/LPS O-acetylase OafA/YrhL